MAVNPVKIQHQPKEIDMIYTTLAIAALAASSALPNLGNVFHLHLASTRKADERIRVVLVNKGLLFCDITVDGHTYTVPSQHNISIMAPAGTPVYAGSVMPGHRRGNLLLTVAPQLKDQVIKFN